MQPTNQAKNSKKKFYLGIIGTVIIISIALGSLIWRNQVADLNGQKSALDTKISELQKELTDLKESSDPNSGSPESANFLSIDKWGIKLDNTPNLTYTIDRMDGKDRLLLTTSKLKTLVSSQCPRTGEGAIYPVTITRSKTDLTEADGIEFMEKLNDILGYKYYLSYGKEPCSTDPTESTQRLDIYTAAKTLQAV